MSEIRSVIDALRAEDVSTTPDARLEQDFEELHAAVESLEAERLRRLAEIDRRRSFERDGFLSSVSWLAHRFRLGHGQAKDSVVFARGLRRSHGVRAALDDGRVSLSAARLLVRAREAEPDAFDRAEGLLVEAAERLPIADLGRVVAHWRDAVQREAATSSGDEALLERRRLHASVTLAGMVRVDADLDPESGEALMTAISAVVDIDARSGGADGDERSPAQRRADALGEICRGWLADSDRSQVAGERPHMLITVPIEALTAPTAANLGNAAVPSTAAELERTGPVDVATLRRLACDASIRRVLLAGASDPLDVGRRSDRRPRGDPRSARREGPAMRVPRVRSAAPMV